MIDCVDDSGNRICNLIYFDNELGGLISSGHAFSILEEENYDTSSLQWGDKGNVLLVPEDD